MSVSNPPGRPTMDARLRTLAAPLRPLVRAGRHRAMRRSPMRTWLASGSRANPSPPDLWEQVRSNRQRLVERLAPGKTFLDLGGMYGIAGDIAFAAESAGASRVVLFDGMDPADEFAKKHQERDSSVEFVQGDLHDAQVIEQLGQFDVVWCAGVIYHSPNPIQQILHLRQLTREHLMLGTHIIPEVPGIEQMCMLYPGIGDESRQTFAGQLGGAERFPGMASEFDRSPLMAYANMWWGFSPSALRSMLHFSGFDAGEEHRYGPYWIDVVSRPGGQPVDIYPPLSQSQGRVRDRHADTPDQDLPSWAKSQVLAIRESDNNES